MNLHVHIHAALSDGSLNFDGRALKFHPAPPPSVVDIAELLAILRVRIFRRMLRQGVGRVQSFDLIRRIGRVDSAKRRPYNPAYA